MKKCIATFLIAACPLFSWAQAQIDVDKEADAERVRIASERKSLAADLQSQEANCYQQFAVTACLGTVRAANREATADLRRQQNTLNDAERRRRGEAQRAKIDQQVLDRQRRAAEQPAAGDAAVTASDSAVKGTTEAQRAEQRKSAQVERQRSHQEELADRAELASEAPANQAKLQEKRLRAEKRREQRDARNRERSNKPPVAGLPPVVPATPSASAPR